MKKFFTLGLILIVSKAFAQSDYCIPQYRYSCSSDYISNVTFNEINRSSTCDGVYSYYSNNTTTVSRGNAYMLSVKTGGDREGVAVWIDYNQNKNFEENEVLLSGYTGNVPATYTTFVVIPHTALTGATRLRVRGVYNTNPFNNPCGEVSYGETEDYLITIDSLSCTPPSTLIEGNNTGCGSVTLTASGGTSYVWSGGLTPNSASNTFNVTGKYYVQVTTAFGCSSVDSQTVNVTPSVTPYISIYTNGPTTICKGWPVQLNIYSISNTGSAPKYQWTVNSQVINGATGTSYTTDSLKNNDTVRCVLTSSAICPVPATVLSNPIVFRVDTIPPKPEIIITASDTSICSGTTVTFTSSITNIGTNSTYQWQKNGVNIPGGSGSTYSTSDLRINDIIRCIYKNNSTCPVNDTSNTILVPITISVTPSITITSSVQQNCTTSEVNKYQFSYLSGTELEDFSLYDSLLFSSGIDDETKSFLALPFNFRYGGEEYSKFSVNSNGIITLGDTTIASSYYRNDVSSFGKLIMPYWDDLYTGSNGSIKYKTIGSQGTRRLIIEWKVNRSNAAYDRIVQVWLYEGSNSIRFVYSKGAVTTGNATIGISLSNSDHLCVNTTNNTVSSSLRDSANIWPSAGVSYLFSPCNSNAVLCTNTSVSFYATAYNGGAAATYQWQKNGNAISGANSNVYTTSSLQSHDTISCMLTSNASCATSNVALSNTIAIDTVAASFTPTVQISVSPSDSISQGTPATFTAMPSYGGTSPSYQWKINGINKGTGNTFITSNLKHQDTVTCEITSSLGCALPARATSNAIIMKVDYCVPKVSIPDNDIYIKNMTFGSIHRNSFLDGYSNGSYSYYNTDSNITTVNRGNEYTLSVSTSPYYSQRVQAWIDYNKNNVFDSAETVLTAFATSALPNYTSNVKIPANAGLGATRLRVRLEYYYNDLQNSPCNMIRYGETEDYLIYIDSVPCTPPAITITGDSTACDTVRLSASGGNTYYWSGGLLQTSASNKFIASGVYNVQVTDSLGCTTTATRTVTVKTSAKPEISIAANDTGLICAGTPILFTATATNPEPLAIYRWIKNGVPVADTSANKYRFDSLANDDQVSCIVFNQCRSDTSNTVFARIVTGGQAPSVTITVSPADTINYGTTVTFKAMPILGGPSPSYQWKINGANVGANSGTYSTGVLKNNDVVTCVLTSNADCATPKTDTSNAITMRVGYCVPISSNSCSGDYISNVAFSTINRNSACDGNYSYYNSDTNTTVAHKGNRYTLTVKTVGYEGAAAWIDYNQNRLFEGDEMIFTAFKDTYQATYSTNFTIPVTSLTGVNRLRVRCMYRSNPGNNPCANVTWGETEDYLIIIDTVSSDLVVDSLNVPAAGFQNRSITVSWKVKNTGEGVTKTGVWKDRIYVTASPQYSPGSALMYYDFLHNGLLFPDSAYTQTQDIQLPANINGRFYVHVFTDIESQITEYNAGGENNNVKISDSIQVFAVMPSDLIITQIASPATGSSGQKVNITWTVKNQGDTALNISNWQDSVYISASPAFDINKAIPLGSFPRAGGLAANSSYTSSVQIALPNLSPGNYYVYVFADASKKAREYDDSNNSRRSSLIQVLIPDLRPVSIAPSSIASGSQLSVKWQDQNTGTGAVENISFTDRIYLSRSNVLDTTNAYWFDVRFSFQTINPNLSAIRNVTFNLPDVVSGNYYVFVRADLNNEIFENSETNNVSAGYYVSLPTNFPLTDIGVSELISPVSSCGLTSQESVKVKIRNYGNVQNSALRIGYRVDDDTVKTETVTGINLLPGGYIDYAFNAKANLSDTGLYTVRIFTDFTNDTIRSNDTLTIVIANYGKLVSPESLVPINESIEINMPVNFSWGGVQHASRYDLYIWKESDTMPAMLVLQDLTQLNYSYQDSPLAFGQRFKWKVDARSGNCVSSSATQTFGIRHLPDLTVDSIAVPPAGGISETSFDVSWRVKRKGGAPIPNSWKDYIYLTESTKDPASGLLLGIFDNANSLHIDTVYSRNNFSFYIPQNYEGQYYIAVITDYANSLIEITDTNNVRLIPFYITLNDYPDLVVDSVIVSRTDAFSGDTLNVSWRVKNVGDGPTPLTFWEDRIYITKVDTLIIPTRLPAVSSAISPEISLLKDSFYVQSARIILPQHVQDTFYVHIWADANTHVYEYVKDSNNTATSEAINIVMSPVPDLTINNVTVSADTTSTNQNVNVQWTTKNEGGAAAFPSWYDGLRLITDTSNPYGSGIWSDYYVQQNTLQSLSATGRQASVPLPPALPEGKYHFYSISDIFDGMYEQNESNNISPFSNPVYVVNPDLNPIGMQAPDTAYSEENIDVSWIVKNIGKGGVYNSRWEDRLYLSTDSTFPAYDPALGYISNDLLLLKNQQYNGKINVQLPRGISGRRYLFVAADGGAGNIYEKNENNNVLRDSIYVKLSPYADLVVTQIQHQAADTAGTGITFSYSVKNAGKAKIVDKTWSDRFYLSPSSNAKDPNRIDLTFYTNTRLSLDTGQVYTNTITAVIPISLSGNYYIVAETNYEKRVYEHTADNNNISAGTSPVAITKLPNVNLMAVSGKATGSFFAAGKPVTFQWTGQNAGSTETIITAWEDAVYLSNNPYLDAGDSLIGIWPVNASLAPGAYYTQTHAATIPVHAAGTLYFILNIDKNNSQNDVSRYNNSVVLQTILVDPGNPSDTGVIVGSGGGITITPAPAADLVPVSFTLSAPAGTAGQPLIAYFTVKNNDTAGINHTGWYDHIILSDDNQADWYDTYLGTRLHTGALPAGALYVDSISFTLPSTKSGNYYLIFKTDARNAVFENKKEDNNTAYNSIFIQQQHPGDLVVAGVTPPAGTYFPGQSIAVEYTLKNTGNRATSDYHRDAFYLSKDSLWDIGDALLGTKDVYHSIAPQDTSDSLFYVRLINISAGNYYVIVRTDILNNIQETDELNNTGISAIPVRVDVKALTMNQTATDTITNGENLYYRIHIPDSLRGETMLLKLTGDSAHHAVNRLYLKYAGAPSGNNYDFVAEAPYEANQDIVVPVLQGGDYYILASGNDTATQYQPVSLLAKIIPFEITQVHAKKGGNTGAVTIKINGAKFDSTTNFYLGSAANGIIYPSKIYYNSSTQVFATFNLLNAKLGWYDLKAQRLNGDTTRSLRDAFEVIAGNGSTAAGSGGPGSGTGFVCQITNIGFEDQLETTVFHPASTRPKRFVAITIYYENTGNVDIPAPTRFIVSLKDSVPLGFTPDEFDKKLTSLPLDFKERGGPPGILRPGANGFIKVYTIGYELSIGSLDFMIIE